MRNLWDILCVYVNILYLNASRLQISNIHTICPGLLSEDGCHNVTHYVAQLGKQGNLFLNQNDQNKAYIPIMRTRWNSIYIYICYFNKTTPNKPNWNKNENNRVASFKFYGTEKLNFV